jgi:hypothetical protein
MELGLFYGPNAADKSLEKWMNAAKNVALAKEKYVIASRKCKAAFDANEDARSQVSQTLWELTSVTGWSLRSKGLKFLLSLNRVRLDETEKVLKSTRDAVHFARTELKYAEDLEKMSKQTAKNRMLNEARQMK